MKIAIYYIFIKVDVQYPEKLQNLHYDLHFLPERMTIEEIEKLVACMYDKYEYIIHIRSLKQAFITD